MAPHLEINANIQSFNDSTFPYPARTHLSVQVSIVTNTPKEGGYIFWTSKSDGSDRSRNITTTIFCIKLKHLSPIIFHYCPTTLVEIRSGTVHTDYLVFNDSRIVPSVRVCLSCVTRAYSKKFNVCPSPK